MKADVRPGGPPAVRGLAGALVAASLGWALHVGAQGPAPATVVACTRPVVVDGRLACDGEAPATRAELCGGTLEHGLADAAIVAGDRLDAARLCAGDIRGHARMAAADLRALQVAIDLNAASADELRSLPGIGPVLAERIVAGRPYAALDDLVRVRGIGPKTLARLRARVLVR